MPRNSNGSHVATGPAFARRSVLRGAAAASAAIVVMALPLARAAAELWEEGDIQCRPIIAEVAPNYLNDEMFAGFMKVSQALTGVGNLDTRIGSQYFERYARHPDLTKLLPPLIKAYRDIEAASPDLARRKALIKRNIVSNKSTLGQAAEQLIYLWYVSAFFLPVEHTAPSRSWIYGTAEQYQASLLWSVVQAHPPMTRGGAPGYWAYPPRT